jgi:hypothetical protein
MEYTDLQKLFKKWMNNENTKNPKISLLISYPTNLRLLAQLLTYFAYTGQHKLLLNFSSSAFCAKRHKSFFLLFLY